MSTHPRESGTLPPLKVWFNGERWYVRCTTLPCAGFDWFYEDRTIPYSESGLARSWRSGRRQVKRARRRAARERKHLA